MSGTRFGVVAIGRNEGERLKHCLSSVLGSAVLVYVDSGSSDGSAQWARNFGAEVVDLDISIPFTAARARNTGVKRLLEMAPDLAYVQFVDGDCELNKSWFDTALAFLIKHKDVGVVFGRLRERCPDRSIYNWMCDQEWDGPVGEVKACGGIAMMRVGAFKCAGGYRENMIAGEEPELCVRLRGAGWRVWRLDAEMALHDAAMTRLSQWWRRNVRSGYAFAQGAYLHGAPPERHWVWESRRAWLWGLWLPLFCLVIGFAFGPIGLTAWLIYPLQILRQMIRNTGSRQERMQLAIFQVLVRFPEVWGQIRFMRDRLFGHQTHIIEYR
ncbi:MAG: glycosyltransferase family 2 protein [Methylovirgula sp.]